MAKFLKSIFHTTDRRKPSHYEHEVEDERSESPPPERRRQLSISRSGRMKQANKKRHSLTLELYGETIQIDAVENPVPMDYQIHSPSHTAPADLEPYSANPGRFDTADMNDVIDLPDQSTDLAKTIEVTLEAKLSTVAIEKSPEEEIDNAFEILDKS
ncbi:uncharacterized protein LOC124642008 [Helicoverpa zea]|uniref:uncharacterized protein LOC124642008 n=1 Tax=Helicoverpa zea TaxID=7113 RepID=UPI001F576770|nr:uncharacterized protein LOC124642008 [Helicoverpa zea]